MEFKKLYLASELIVRFLDGWKIDKRDYGDSYIRFIGGGGRLIILRDSFKWNENNRVIAQGAISKKNRGLDFQTFGQEIGFSFSRSPIAQAQEIKRRLLKNYEKQFLEITTKLKIDGLEAQKKIDKVNSFLHAFPLLEKSKYNYESSFRFYEDVFSLKKDGNFFCSSLKCSLYKSGQKNKNLMGLYFTDLPENLAYKLLDLYFKYNESIENE